MGIAIVLVMVIIFRVVSAALIPKLSGAAAGAALPLITMRTAGNATELGKGLAAIANGNKGMTEDIRQQVTARPTSSSRTALTIWTPAATLHSCNSSALKISSSCLHAATRGSSTL